MEESLIQQHLSIGKECGQERTCGKKIDYKSEATATKSADQMNKKNNNKVLEPYPCYFCKGWHIGRKMI